MIFPHIDVCKVLLRNHSNKAMQIMEEGEAITAKESAKSFQKIVGIPFGKTKRYLLYKDRDIGNWWE